MQGRRIVTSVHPPGRQMTANIEPTMERETTMEISCGCCNTIILLYQRLDWIVVADLIQLCMNAYFQDVSVIKI